MLCTQKTSRLALALLATTMLTQPGPARAAPGDALGPEFQVNTFTLGDQVLPAVAMDADGHFVVAWEGYGSSELKGIFAKRFDATGVAQGSEFLVNSFTTNNQNWSAIAMDADGDFVVAWESRDQDGSLYGIFAQRFDAAGVAQGSEVQVNTFSTSAQRLPAVAMDTDGDFVVAWTSYEQDGSDWGVFAQRYDAAGVAQGAEIPVNSHTTSQQIFPAVAMDVDGDFVVAWQSNGQDGSSYGVFAQRYDGVARVAGDFDGDGNADILWHNAATGTAVVWLMDGTEKLAVQSIGGAPVVWQVARIGEFNGDGKADILWHNAVTGAALVWQMDGFARTAAVGVGGAPTAWVIEKVEDTDGDGLSDIFWRNSATGATVVWLIRGFARVEVGGTGSVPADWQTH